MSFITRKVFLSVCHQRFTPCTFICNQVRLSRIQYFSLINAGNMRSEAIIPNIIGSRKASFLTIIQHQKEKLYSALSDLVKFRFGYIPVFGVGKYKLAGFLWYRTLEDLDIAEYFTLFEMPDTFYSRFRVVELHVWMLLFVLPGGNRINNVIKHSIIQAMWLDCEKRAKLVQELNKQRKKNIEQFYEDFKMNLLFYDAAFCKDDVSLSNALWYCFFNKKDVDPRLLEALVYYVRHQVNYLLTLNLEKLSALGFDENKGKIWISPKPFVESILQYKSTNGRVALEN